MGEIAMSPDYLVNHADEKNGQHCANDGLHDF